MVHGVMHGPRLGAKMHKPMADAHAPTTTFSPSPSAFGAKIKLSSVVVRAEAPKGGTLGAAKAGPPRQALGAVNTSKTDRTGVATVPVDDRAGARDGNKENSAVASTPPRPAPEKPAAATPTPGPPPPPSSVDTLMTPAALLEEFFTAASDPKEPISAAAVVVCIRQLDILRAAGSAPPATGGPADLAIPTPTYVQRVPITGPCVDS